MAGPILLLSLLAPVGELRLLPSPTAHGEWPAYRGDPALTGRCQLPGRILTPTVTTQAEVGPVRVLLDVSPTAGEGRMALPPPTELAPHYLYERQAEWDAGATLLDLSGDGNASWVTRSTNVVYGAFLPDAAGLQKFVMEDGMSVKTRPDGPRRPVAIGSLYRFDRGKEERAWQTEPEEQCEIPLCAAADMNGDGRDEILVATWWRVMVFDAATGRKIAECKWHNGRNYGHFQVADLNGDGRPECIVFADFMIHLNVLTWRDGNLELAWRKEVDFSVFGKRKSLQTLPDAVVRRAGADPLLVANLYNDSGDGQWHTLLLQPMSGEIVLDLSGRLCAGQVDLAGDGNDALLLARTNGVAIRRVGDLSVLRRGEDGWRETPLPVQGRWLTRHVSLPPDRATIAANGDRTALVTGHDDSRLLWLDAPGEAGATRVIAVRPAGDGFDVAGSLTVPAAFKVDVAAVARDGARLLLNCSGPSWTEAAVDADGLRVAAVSVQRPEIAAQEPVLARLTEGGPVAVVSPYGGTSVAVMTLDGRQLRVDWTREGRTRTDGSGSTSWGPVVADLFEDGSKQVLAAVEESDGRAALVAYDAHGRERYRHRFPIRFPGDEPVWNHGGLINWSVGPYAAGRPAIVATLRRTVMHTDETVLLRPSDDTEIWWQDNLDQRGCGGKPVALAADAIIGQYPDIHYVLDASDGRARTVVSYPHQQLGGWSAYGLPVLLDATDDGRIEVLTGGCTYTLALWTAAGELRWHTDYLDGTSRAVALRRHLNRWEIGAAAYRGGFRCYRAADGELLWSFEPGMRVVTDVVTCDIDGDGEEEFLFGAGGELIALGGDDRGPQIRWRLEFPHWLRSVVPGDVDGDGQSELVVTTADGLLSIVDGTR